jgi:hypothetical protein
MNMFQDSEIDAITTGDPFGCPPHGKYEKLISLAKQVPPATTVVVYPCDETSLRGASAAADLGIIDSGWPGRKNYGRRQATWDRYRSL